MVSLGQLRPCGEQNLDYIPAGSQVKDDPSRSGLSTRGYWVGIMPEVDGRTQTSASSGHTLLKSRFRAIGKFISSASP
jgi:hypothetical protein